MAYLTFVKAVILILKHATFLRLSNLSPESALTHAELDYREAKIDLKIQQHLTASSQEQSVELFAAFIMATDMVRLFLHLLRQCLVKLLVASQSSVKTHAHKKDHWFKRFWEPVFPRKSTFLPKLRNATREDK